MTPSEIVSKANQLEDRGELARLAREELGLVLNVTWAVGTLRKKIAEAAAKAEADCPPVPDGGQGDGAPYDSEEQGDQPEVDEPAQAEAEEDKPDPDSEVEVFVNKTEDKRDYVFAGVNGVSVRIPKGKWVRIKRKFVNPLADAIVGERNEKGEISGQRISYPFNMREIHQ